MGVGRRAALWCATASFSGPVADAALELDAARDDLPSDQLDELAAVWRMKWGGK